MRIEEITKQRLEKATDLELKQLKFKFAKFWDRHFKSNTREIVGCFSRGNFISRYRLLLKEMGSSRRSLEHSTCDIDRQAFRQSMQVKQDGVDIGQISEIITGKNCIVMNVDFAKADKIQITVQQEAEGPDEQLEKVITKMFGEQFDKPIGFSYQRTIEGDVIPLFHEILMPVTKIEVVKLEGEEEDNKGVEEVEKNIELVPVEKGEEHIVYGIVYEPDVKDAQGDQANAAEIKKAAYNFMENVQTFKVMHKGKKVKIKILENFIAPVDFTVEKREVKKGTWILVTRILDKQVWKDIKAGKLTGYSMAGYAKVD